MTRRKLYKVELNAEERDELIQLISSGMSKARDITRARVLLKADQGIDGPGWIDRKIIEAFDISHVTVGRIRKQYCEEGIEKAIQRKKHDLKQPRTKLDGRQEAQLIALVQSKAPKGRLRWTIRLLASEMVEREIVDEISRETVRRTLKKMSLSLGKRNRG